MYAARSMIIIGSAEFLQISVSPQPVEPMHDGQLARHPRQSGNTDAQQCG